MTHELFKRASTLALFFSLTVANAAAAQAADQCRDAFAFSSSPTASSPVISAFDYTSASVAQQRQYLLDELRAKSLPAFVKETQHGQLPIVLVTHETNPHLKTMMSQTVGSGTLLQPGSGYSDHGLLRIGGVHPQTSSAATFSLQIDWAPMNRNWWDGDTGEIHRTGIMWRNLETRMKESFEKNRYSRVTLEVAIAMKEKDRGVVLTHQRIRRAGLISLVGEFPAYVMTNPSPVELEVRENCFQLASGSTLTQMQSALVSFLQTKGLTEPLETLRRPKVRRFLEEARSLVNRAGMFSATELNPHMLMTNARVRRIFSLALPKFLIGKDAATTEQIANALLALDSTQKTSILFKRYGFKPNMTARDNIDNPAVLAILVYDSPDKAPSFRDGSYITKGAFGDTGWGDADATQPYADQHPL